MILLCTSTLPVTTATSERSFSAPNYLKKNTFGQPCMGEARQNSLGHTRTNRDIELNNDNVIDEFALKNCRLSFLRTLVEIGLLHRLRNKYFHQSLFK